MSRQDAARHDPQVINAAVMAVVTAAVVVGIGAAERHGVASKLSACWYQILWCSRQWTVESIPRVNTSLAAAASLAVEAKLAAVAKLAAAASLAVDASPAAAASLGPEVVTTLVGAVAARLDPPASLWLTSLEAVRPLGPMRLWPLPVLVTTM